MTHHRIAWAVLALAVGAPLACGHDESADVPAVLSAIESAAEDAFDLALGADEAGVSAKAHALADDWEGYRGTAQSDGVSSVSVSALDDAVDSLQSSVASGATATVLARSCNAVSGAMPAFFAAYDPPIPSSVLELDYLGREIQLDAIEGDLARATTDVDAIDATWQSLRMSVVDAGGTTAATAFDDSIAGERAALAAGDAATVETDAIDQLELVDGIERVFSDAHDPPD